MIKNTSLIILGLALFLPSGAIWAQNLQSPMVKMRKQNLSELEKMLKVRKEKEILLSDTLKNRRKRETVSANITHHELVPIYDARQSIKGYRFDLRRFFDKVIEAKPKNFYYPLTIEAIKIHYEGRSVATIGYCGSNNFARLYSYYKSGDGRFMFPNNPHDYSRDLYLYFETNDKMKSKVSVTYQGIDGIGHGAEKFWQTDRKRLSTYEQRFYSKIAALPNEKKSDSVFKQLVDLITYIEHKYDKSSHNVRRLIEQKYRRVWLAQLRKMMEEKNRNMDRILERAKDLDEAYSSKRATWNLNSYILREFQLELELNKALDTSDVKKYLDQIKSEIEEAEK